MTFLEVLEGFQRWLKCGTRGEVKVLCRLGSETCPKCKNVINTWQGVLSYGFSGVLS